MELKYDKSRYFDIPRKFYFEVGNTSIGSSNTFNYRISTKDDKFCADIWYGMLCFELCEVVSEKEFDGGDDGYKELIYWIDEQYEEYLKKLEAGEVQGRRTFTKND